MPILDKYLPNEVTQHKIIIDETHNARGVKGIKIKKINPSSSQNSAEDGYTRHQKNSTTNYLITLTIAGFSPTNAKMKELEETGGEFDLSVVDINGNNERAQMTQCLVQDQAEFSKGLQEEADNVWIMTANYGELAFGGAGLVLV